MDGGYGRPTRMVPTALFAAMSTPAIQAERYAGHAPIPDHHEPRDAEVLAQPLHFGNQGLAVGGIAGEDRHRLGQPRPSVSEP